jgi:hypothetical protein
MATSDSVWGSSRRVEKEQASLRVKSSRVRIGATLPTPNLLVKGHQSRRAVCHSPIGSQLAVVSFQPLKNRGWELPRF